MIRFRIKNLEHNRTTGYLWIFHINCFSFYLRKGFNLVINATKKWIFLKVSAAIMVPLMVWFLFGLVSVYDKPYNEVLLFFTSQPNKFLFSMFIIFVYFYSSLSISEVFEDYIENEKLKNVANKLLYLFAITVPIITLLVLYKLSL